MRPLTKTYKKELDQSIGYAIREGCLDDDEARKMTYKQKQEWLDKSEARAEALYDVLKEEGEI